jgi:hypothetical protein
MVGGGVVLRIRSFALAISLAVACQGCDKGAVTEKKAIEVTKAQMTKELPQVDLRIFVIEAEDLGSKWQVTYEIPGGSTGTPVVFEVDKNSGKIVSAHGP